MESLQLVNSPYYIQFSDKVNNCLKLAIDNGLYKNYAVDKQILPKFIKEKGEIPLWILETACKINENSINIPAQYQNIWFCLHNSILRRKQPSGREFNTKVNFNSCYIVLDKEIRNLLKEACKAVNLPTYKFVHLCGFTKVNWTNENIIPLIAVIKICQILKLDVWNLLEGCVLFSKTQKVGKIIMPRNKKDIDLITLLIWLRTEGHLELSLTHIEINQKNNINSLIALKKLFVKIFNLSEKSLIFAKGKRGEDRLIISSSPLRQYLSLRYDFPLGYKSGSLVKMDLSDLSISDYRKIIPAFIQTEGCLSSHNTRNKKKKLPRFEFIVKDKALAEDCSKVMRKLGFQPKCYSNQNIFKVGLYNSKEVIKLIDYSKPYFLDDKKIKYLKQVCSSGIGL